MQKESIEAMLADLERVRKLAKQAVAKENFVSYRPFNGDDTVTYMRNGKLTDSLRRASLDLTRSLADMRKP